MGVLCIGGGALGYAKKKSVPSLVAGVGLGGAYLASSYLIGEVDALQGHAVGLATSVVLTSAMGARFLKSKKLMPAGIMAAAGLLAGVYHGMKIPEWLP